MDNEFELIGNVNSAAPTPAPTDAGLGGFELVGNVNSQKTMPASTGAVFGTTQGGRPIVGNEDGSVSTERTITITDDRINGGMPTNIPTMFGGKIVGDAEAADIIAANGGFDPETGAKLRGFGSIDEAVQFAEQRSSALGAEVDGANEFETIGNINTPNPKDMGFLDRYVLNPLGRGKNNTMDQAANVIGLSSGILNPDEFVDAYLKDKAEAESYPQHPDDAAAMQNILTTGDRVKETWNDPNASKWDVAKATGSMLGEAVTNPGVVTQVAMESLPTIGATVGGTALGAMAGSAVPGVGTVAGGAVGAGAASGATEFLNSITGFLEDKGYAADRDTLVAAIQNPEVMAQARDYAAKRGMSVGVFDMISGGLAGKVAGPVARATSRMGQTGAKLAGAGAEAVVQGAGGSAGEATAQLASTGEINSPAEVMLEGVAEVPGAAVEVPGIVMARRAGARVAGEPVDALTKAQPAAAAEPEGTEPPAFAQQMAEDLYDNEAPAGEAANDLPVEPAVPDVQAVPADSPDTLQADAPAEGTQEPVAQPEGAAPAQGEFDFEYQKSQPEEGPDEAGISGAGVGDNITKSEGKKKAVANENGSQLTLFDTNETNTGEGDFGAVDGMFADNASRAPTGKLTPQTEDVSYSTGASKFTGAFRAAGLDPDQGVLLPPKQKLNVLARSLKNQFDLDVTRSAKRPASIVDSVDQMNDAFNNLQMMAHSLNIPATAISLGGRVNVSLERKNGAYFGAYNPETKTIHMPGRSNSFAHEWGHALDHYLLDQLKPNSSATLATRAARAEGMDPSVSLEASVAHLVNTMFFDDADLAVRVAKLERDAQSVDKQGNPTKKAIAAQMQIERLTAGNTRLKIKPSEYRKNSAEYGGGGYWASVHELMARAFEAYVASRVAANDGDNAFITKGEKAYLSDADTRLAKTFPKAADRLRIFAAFDDIFDLMRNQQLFGSDAAAKAPDARDLLAPQNWNKLATLRGEQGFAAQLKTEAQRIINMGKNLADGKRPTAKGALMSTAAYLQSVGVPTDRDGLRESMRRIADVSRFLAYSSRGMLKAINKRQPKDAQPFLDHIFSKIMSDPGTGKQNQGVTFEEAREREALKVANRMSSTLLNHGFRESLSTEDADIIRSLMINEKPGKTPTPDHIAVAAELRRIYDDAYRAATEAGIDVGYVEDKGYLPRSIVRARVQQNVEAFVRDAIKVYETVFENFRGDLDADAAVKLARQFEFENPALTALTKAVRKAQKDLKKAKTPQEEAAAEADIKKAQEDLLDELKPAYANRAARDWAGRILIGDSSTYDSHGPSTNFTKPRTLPPEADAMLKDWYDTDVLHSTLNYAHDVYSRVAYQERFGKSGSEVKRLRDVIKRPDVQHRIKANPNKYNADTAQGRLNILNDLANPKTDNILEMALWEAQEFGANGEDVQHARGYVQDVTGRKDQSLVNHFMSRFAAGVYLYTYIKLLPRAAVTALTEPMTFYMRTGEFKTSMKVMHAYMQEAFREAKDTQERAAIARQIGLVATPLHDVVLMNRVNGDFGHVGVGNSILAKFFRANGLAQLTNAQRRAVFVGAHFWLHDLAVRHEKATGADKEIIENHFRDQGIPEHQMEDMIAWARSKDGLPSLADWETREGRVYADAISRFIDQTIQNPRRVDKPMMAASPVGRSMYALTAFLYTFFRNVHLYNMNVAKMKYETGIKHGESRKQAGMRAAGHVGRTLALGFAQLYAAQFAIAVAREAAFSSEQWDKHKKDKDQISWLAKLTLTRTGVFGPFDPLYNAYTGLKYERDLTSMWAGPGLTTAFADIQNIINGSPWGPRNSASTNTAEHTAMKSVYRLAMVPALNIGLSALETSGPASWLARYAAMVYGSSYSAASGFADATVGERGAKTAPR
nr:LPD1 domain-containing protein [uncultured Cohaesibacter sp.]